MTNIKYEPDRRIHPTAQQLEPWEAEEKPAGLVASGPCPACGHEFATVIPRTVVTEIAAADEKTVPPEKRLSWSFRCGCTETHAGRPPAIPGGCGRWWLATIVSQDDGTRKVERIADESLAPAIAAFSQAATDELAATRGWAEKWLPATAALYGLFGLATIALGNDALDSLPTEGRLAAAILIGIGGIATGIAVWQGYLAAFGWREQRTITQDAELAAWFDARRAAAAEAPRHLAKALGASIAALALLLAAVGVFWFWPPADPPSPLVEVQYLQNGDASLPASACGKLVSSKDGNIAIRASVGGTSQPVTVPVATIQKVTVKDSC